MLLASVVLVTLAACGGGNGAPQDHDVARVLTENCTGCHTEGGVGPFALDDPRRSATMAREIARVVRDEIMPPWPPGAESPTMRNERKLSPEDKAVLVAWAESGASLPELSSETGNGAAKANGRQPELSLVIEPRYRPDRSLGDDYRCFLLDPELTEDSFVTGYEVRTDQSELVHHALIFVIGAEAVEGARAQDALEEGSGWTCFGGPGLGTNLAGFGLLGFWVPGGDSTEFPEGTGKLLEARSQLVMQVHYHVQSRSDDASDASGVELFLAASTAEIDPIDEIALAAPVEVRCPGVYPTDPQDPCNRDYALEHSELRLGADLIHLLCETRIDDYLTSDVGDGSVQPMSCDRRVSEESLALGVTGHMHLRGRSITILLNPDTNEAETLLDIPRWNFEWQGQYWFQDAVSLKTGDLVRITCVYDNSGPVPGPDGELLPPRYMTWGEGTTDEMCLGALTVVER